MCHKHVKRQFAVVDLVNGSVRHCARTQRQTGDCTFCARCLRTCRQQTSAARQVAVYARASVYNSQTPRRLSRSPAQNSAKHHQGRHATRRVGCAAVFQMANMHTTLQGAETLESKSHTFLIDKWSSPPTRQGITAVLQDGTLIEKASLSVSNVVSGLASPAVMMMMMMICLKP